MITPPLISSAESNGDIYYSTFLRFVKRLSEDFSKILRSGLPNTSLHPAMLVSDFEENTGLLQNRYLIIYPQIHTLSSQIQNKKQKKSGLFRLWKEKDDLTSTTQMEEAKGVIPRGRKLK